MKKVVILGCTGSVGSTAIRVIRKYRDEFRVLLLANFSKSDEIDKLHREFPECSVYTYQTAEDKEFLHRPETYLDADVVINGIPGIAGLAPSYAVLCAGKVLATANKESLVCAGGLLKKTMSSCGGKIYPLDSEHSAVWQCLRGQEEKSVKKIVLTASGGAFRDRTKDELLHVTPKEALMHPNWNMGAKVTVDCATLVNKGMEIIEAKHLFNTENVTAVLHRQSLIHALVCFCDNSVLASISVPDMVLPVQYALFYPQRRECDLKELELDEETIFSFGKIDEDRFPGFSLCREAEKRGDYGGTILNAADEAGVSSFLAGKCSFYGITDRIERALIQFPQKGEFTDLSDVFRMDKEVGEYILSEFGS